MDKKYNTVSQWINDGGLRAGFSPLENPAKETAKAIGFKASGFDSYGYEKAVIAWFPKSQVIKVANDYYENGEAEMFLVPQWLMDKKRLEGLVIL